MEMDGKNIKKLIDEQTDKLEVPASLQPEAVVERLEEKIKQALDELKDCEGILILCDLIGGSPFKSSVILGTSKENVEIIAGTNLPMLVEAYLLCQVHNDVKQLTKQLNLDAPGVKERFFHAITEGNIDGWPQKCR